MTALHHLALSAANLDTSAAFYDPFLAELGYHREGGVESPLVYLGEGPEILVYAVEGSDAARHRHGAPGLQHLAFQVDERKIVDAAHRAADAAGGTVVHAPRLYPEYADGYYATFVEDPDGSRFEVLSVPRS
ncbi:VOC family protein [Dactylosporangium sp. NPDC050688]|uniref:VOC family protein n=1 Tax=Dactylosporangium sp. NPDC050688 TaxID=3157217 RepID=UPI00340B4696